ncbi:hypothetical protein [Oscillibacter sp.]|uniref:hypothetical protein n=1 Tax=Oscillibacter sp. TaxID=1945593 RepID=UPI00339A1443
MERNLLVGNGINIQFGGVDVYSGSAIMNRVIENIRVGKYTPLTENSLSIDEQLGLLDGMVKEIDLIKAGKCRSKADGLFMLMELERITRTYPDNSSIISVLLEDYFLAFEIFNNGFKAKDGEERSESYRKIIFRLLSQMLVDGIYNDGAINDVYKNFYMGMNTYLSGFSNIFTTNYDYNLENILSAGKVCHLHGEFGKLAPEYDVTSLYYSAHKAECDAMIYKKIPNMDHVYSDAIMSWSWLDKYGKLIEPNSKSKEELFKSISGQLEIVGLAPANDEHLFLLINNNPKIKSVVYYYHKDEDRDELPHHLKKPVTYKKVANLWTSMK